MIFLISGNNKTENEESCAGRWSLGGQDAWFCVRSQRKVLDKLIRLTNLCLLFFHAFFFSFFLSFFFFVPPLLLLFLSYPFDVSSLSPEIKAAVYSCLDYVLHKGTAHKGITSYTVCIMDLYIFYKFLKYSTKVSWPKQTNIIWNLFERWK